MLSIKSVVVLLGFLFVASAIQNSGVLELEVHNYDLVIDGRYNAFVYIAETAWGADNRVLGTFYSWPDMLVAKVSYENWPEIKERYKIDKAAWLYFKKGSLTPTIFEETDTDGTIVRAKEDLMLHLNPEMHRIHEIAAEFMKDIKVTTGFAELKELVNSLEEPNAKEYASTYLKYMKKISENGMDFFINEREVLDKAKTKNLPLKMEVDFKKSVLGDLLALIPVPEKKSKKKKKDEVEDPSGGKCPHFQTKE